MKNNKTKKSCLNCAFCQRIKVILPKRLQVYPTKIMLSLTEKETEKAFMDDYSFLGNSKQEKELWIQEYKNKKEQREKKLKEIEELRNKNYAPISAIATSLNCFNKISILKLDSVVTSFCDIINVEVKEEISHGKYATKTRCFG